MSENVNGNGVDTEEVLTETSETEATETALVEDTEVDNTPETVPYSRLSEVVAQRQAEREARERAENELYQLRQTLAAQQAQLQQAQPQQPRQPQPWESYQDPNTRALAQLMYQVNQQSTRGLSEKLDRFETVVETIESQNFWSRFPTVPAELQAKTEQLYTQARHMGITRDTALTYAYGELQRAQLNQQVNQAAASAQQQAQVNKTARAAVVPQQAPMTRPATQPIKSSSDYLRQIEADENKRRR